MFSVSTLKRSLGSALNGDTEGALKALVDIGWDRTLLDVRSVSNHEATIVANLGQRPQLLLSLRSRAHTGTPDSASLSRAYSSEAPFTFELDSDSAALHETARWDTIPGDSPLVQEDAGDLSAIANAFALLSPTSVVDLDPSSLFSVHGRVYERLAAKLGNALAELRRDAGLPGDADPAEVRARDLSILRLFHQLLYIRFYEDRTQVSNDDKIGALIGSRGASEVLQQKLDHYATQFQSELFTAVVLDPRSIPNIALQRTLKALVEPWESLHLDFRLTPSDVAGRLYETYLGKTPAWIEGEALFGTYGTTDSRGKQGSFYTPIHIAAHLSEKTLGPWLDEHKPQSFAEVHVLDPACGSGAFLLSSYRILKSYFENLWDRDLTQQERKDLLASSIFGADLDESALMLAQVQLYEEADLGDSSLPTMGENLLQGDALLSPPGSAFRGGIHWDNVMNRTGGFDCILANPPFGAQVSNAHTENRNYRKSLSEIYPELKSWGADLAYYFLDLGKQLAREDGTLGFVLPRKILSGGSAAKARELLLSIGVRSVEDFRGCHLFPQVSAYVALVVAGGAGTSSSSTVSLAEVSDSQVPAELVLDIDHERSFIRNSRTSATVLRSCHETSWTPFELRWRSLASPLEHSKGSLGDATWLNVASGTQTGDNSRYVFDFPRDQKAIKVQNVSLSRRATMRWIRGTDILPFRLMPDREARVLLPTIPIPGYESEMEDVVNKLGLPKNVQPGNVEEWRKPKVLLRSFGKELNAASDPVGDIICPKGTAGAFAIVPADSNPDTLDAIVGLLQSSFYQWFLRGVGEPKADESIELLEGVILRLPWPELNGVQTMALAKQVRSIKSTLSLENASARSNAWWEGRLHLDEMVLELLGANKVVRDMVRRELFRPA